MFSSLEFMNIERDIKKRAQGLCELCGHAIPENLKVYTIPKTPEYIKGAETTIYACITCTSQFDIAERDENHWRCLNDSMWSPVAPVQVMAWRMLHRIKSFGWSQDLIDMMYMEEQQLEWAAADDDAADKSEALVHRDANGVVLQAGDSVVLIKDLKVKGSSMVAKQGTAVRRISLDHENEKYVEGKVDGQQIVIITDYVKKL